MRRLVFFVTISGLAQPLWLEPNQRQVYRSVEFPARSGGSSSNPQVASAGISSVGPLDNLLLRSILD